MSALNIAHEEAGRTPVLLAAWHPPRPAHELLQAPDAFPLTAVHLRSVRDRSIDAALRTTVICYWNHTGFSVRFSGRFTELRLTPASGEEGLRTPGLWEKSDVFECFFGSEREHLRRYFELQIAPDGRWIEAMIRRDAGPMQADFSWHADAERASSVDRRAGEWRSVISIPWRHLDLVPVPGASFRANFFRASGRFHGDELLSWSRLPAAEPLFHQPDRFGRVVLC